MGKDPKADNAEAFFLITCPEKYVKLDSKPQGCHSEKRCKTK